MTEPDFEQLAAQAISGSSFHIARVAEALRQVWNARGLADLQTLREGWALGPFTKAALLRAIKALDR